MNRRIQDPVPNGAGTYGLEMRGKRPPKGEQCRNRQLGKKAIWKYRAIDSAAMGMSFNLHGPPPPETSRMISLIRAAVRTRCPHSSIPQKVYGPFTNGKKTSGRKALAPFRGKSGDRDEKGFGLEANPADGGQVEQYKLVALSTSRASRRLSASKAAQGDAIEICSTQHRVDSNVPIEEVAGAVKKRNQVTKNK